MSQRKAKTRAAQIKTGAVPPGQLLRGTFQDKPAAYRAAFTRALAEHERGVSLSTLAMLINPGLHIGVSVTLGTRDFFRNTMISKGGMDAALEQLDVCDPTDTLRVLYVLEGDDADGVSTVTLAQIKEALS